MGRIYTAQFSAIAVSALQDLWEVLSPTDAVTKIHACVVFQTSDVGDAAEEILRLECVRGVGTVTSGSGGATVTPQPVEDGDPAYGGTIERNNTTRMAAGTGTLETLPQLGWNVRETKELWLPPELLPTLSPGNRWTLALPAAPADALTMGSTIWLEEIGG